MKKIINEPENFVKEMIEGIVAAHSDKRKKVGIVTAEEVVIFQRF